MKLSFFFFFLVFGFVRMKKSSHFLALLSNFPCIALHVGGFCCHCYWFLFRDMMVGHSDTLLAYNAFQQCNGSAVQSQLAGPGCIPLLHVVTLPFFKWGKHLAGILSKPGAEGLLTSSCSTEMHMLASHSWWLENALF